MSHTPGASVTFCSAVLLCVAGRRARARAARAASAPTSTCASARRCSPWTGTTTRTSSCARRCVPRVARRSACLCTIALPAPYACAGPLSLPTLQARARRMATDWHTHNLERINTLTGTATLIREEWATWNPQRAAAKALEDAVKKGTLRLEVRRLLHAAAERAGACRHGADLAYSVCSTTCTLVAGHAVGPHAVRAGAPARHHSGARCAATGLGAAQRRLQVAGAKGARASGRARGHHTTFPVQTSSRHHHHA